MSKESKPRKKNLGIHTLTNLHDEDALVVLIEGISDDAKVEHLVLGFSNYPGPVVVLDLPQAVLRYVPSSAKPTHVVIWTNSATMLFDYHALDYIQRPDADD